MGKNGNKKNPQQQPTASGAVTGTKVENEAVESLKASEIAVPEEKPKTVLKIANDYLSDHKLILGLFVTIGTIAISACMYLYRQGYLAYFNVGNEWNNYADKSLFYTLAWPLCLAIIIVAFWAILFLPVCESLDKLLRKKYVIYILAMNSGFFLQSVLIVVGHPIILAIVWITQIILSLIFLDKMEKSENATEERHKIKFDFCWHWGIIIVGYALFIGAVTALIPLIHCFDAFGWKQYKQSCWLFGSFVVIEWLVNFMLYEFWNTEIIKKDKQSSALDTMVLVLIFGGIVFAFLGLSCYFSGYESGKDNKILSVIYTSYSDDVASETTEYSNELSGLALPSADAVHQINEILTTTATTGTTVLQSSATTVTTTTVQTAAADTSQEETSEPVIVYVVLAENKDCYLTSIGQIDAGGILHIDRSVEYTQEKKIQVALIKKFEDVRLDYTYPKEVTP